MNRSFAFVFPGQGSQKLGMLSTFEHIQVIRDTFAEASEVLGEDLWQLCQTGPESKLNDTQWTQPVLLTASVALWRFWQRQFGMAVLPKAFAGHSLGEYSALVCAGALEFETAVKLVQMRGQFMQQAVPEGAGAMAAILGLAKEQVVALCAQVSDGAADGVCEAVNFNSPEQTVVAGDKQAIEAYMVLAKANGAKRALPLPVSVPSHCRLMKPAAQQLLDYMQTHSVTFAKPNLPLLHNYDVQAHDAHQQIQHALVQQLFHPVRWVETIEALAQQGIDTYIECGPGKVLGGLIKRIQPNAQVYTLETLGSVEELQAQLSTEEVR